MTLRTQAKNEAQKVPDRGGRGKSVGGPETTATQRHKEQRLSVCLGMSAGSWCENKAEEESRSNLA